MSAMMDRLKDLNYRALAIRIGISIIGTILSSFGVGCYYGCGLGTDPISVFVDGLHNVCQLSYGQISTICNVILTVLIFLFERKHLGIGTLIGMFLGGPLIDVFETLIRTNFPVSEISLATKVIILLAGLLTTGIGYALCIGCKMGIGCFQFVPIFMSDVMKMDIRYTQMISDAVFFLIGLAMGGVIGIGTIVGVLCTGYILSFVLRKTLIFVEQQGDLLPAK